MFSYSFCAGCTHLYVRHKIKLCPDRPPRQHPGWFCWQACKTNKTDIEPDIKPLHRCVKPIKPIGSKKIWRRLTFLYPIGFTGFTRLCSGFMHGSILVLLVLHACLQNASQDGDLLTNIPYLLCKGPGAWPCACIHWPPALLALKSMIFLIFWYFLFRNQRL